MPDVTVIDYGMGNLFSVMRAIEFCGGTPVVAETPDDLANAERVFLPGVGAFRDGMAELDKRGFAASIQDYVATDRPLLGICLGMQLLLTYGEEFGEHKGLNIVPGRVTAIPPTGKDGTPHRVPHVGWNEIAPIDNEEASWNDTLLENTHVNASVYFVHSYHSVCDDLASNIAVCNYNGRSLSAVIQKGNIYGCQFHPEKSGPVGLNILRNFIHLDRS